MTSSFTESLSGRPRYRVVSEGGQMKERRSLSTYSLFSLTSLRSLFVSVFLPKGFPSSVGKDYVAYQFWDTVQALSSSLLGSIATMSVLKGAGVGNKSATALAASLTWLVRDGVSLTGRILFSYLKGSDLDSDSKRWRLLADLCVDISFLVDLLCPMFPTLFLPMACTSSLLRCVVSVAGGSTKMATIQHLARQRNVADVAAKDGSQECFVHIVALLLSLVILPVVSGKTLLIWTLYLLFAFIHLFANYRAVTSLQLRSLNRERAILVIRSFLSTGRVPSIADCNRDEPLFGSRFDGRGLGCSLFTLMSLLKAGQKTAVDFECDRYQIVLTDRSWISMRSGTSNKDQLEALFISEKIKLQGSNYKNHLEERQFEQLMSALAEADYNTDVIQLGFAEWRYQLDE